MGVRLSIVVLTALSVSTPAAQSGQVPADDPQPVFRAASSFVRVDMYATRDGEFVTDLRPEEIEVLEDGVPQRIDTFEYVRVDAAPGDDPAAAIADDARSRVFVVFIDTHTTQLERQPDLRLSLVRFLDRVLAPGDLVALVTPDMSIDEVTLGRRSTVISDVANDTRWIQREPDERQNLQEFAWENCYPSRGGPSSRVAEMKARRRGKETIEALQDLVLHLRNLREERKAVLLVTAGWPLATEPARYTGSRVETAACAADRRALAGIDYGEMLRDLARAANRSNVSFYPVNSRRPFNPADFPPSFRNGVAVNGAIVQQRQHQMRNISQRPLSALAEDTDGRAESSIEGLDRLTDQIIADTSAYYLIGYQSSNPRPDGRFRSITVKVRRDGVRVRARPGYGGEAPPPRAPEARIVRERPIDSRVTIALEPVTRFDTFAPMWLRAAPWGGRDDGDGGAFWFIGEVGALRTRAPWTSGASAQVEVLASDKRPVLTRAFDLSAGRTAFGVRVPEAGYLAPGDYLVRVRLMSSEADGAPVYDSTRVRIGPEEGVGSAVLWRGPPSPRLEYLQTADPRFRRNERLRLEFPTTSDSAPSARLLDRLGQPLQIPARVTERHDPTGEFDWIVVDAALTGLAPGDYAVELIQDGGTRITGFRIVP